METWHNRGVSPRVSRLALNTRARHRSHLPATRSNRAPARRMSVEAGAPPHKERRRHNDAPSSHSNPNGRRLATAVASASAFADDFAVQWKNVLGLLQVNNVVGSGTGAVTGGGPPWSTLGGNAAVDLQNGHVNFEVRGLVFAGGNTSGTPGPITQVKGTLVCDTDGSAGGGTRCSLTLPLCRLTRRAMRASTGPSGPCRLYAQPRPTSHSWSALAQGAGSRTDRSCAECAGTTHSAPPNLRSVRNEWTPRSSVPSLAH